MKGHPANYTEGHTIKHVRTNQDEKKPDGDQTAAGLTGASL